MQNANSLMMMSVSSNVMMSDFAIPCLNCTLNRFVDFRYQNTNITAMTVESAGKIFYSMLHFNYDLLVNINNNPPGIYVF